MAEYIETENSILILSEAEKNDTGTQKTWWARSPEYKTCGDCIHAKICEHMPTLTGFSKSNPAYCRGFKAAADVVEVCRCQNCIHSKYFEESGIRNCLNSKGFYRTVADNDFCSYGERRSE